MTERAHGEALDLLLLADQGEWRRWLEEHQASSRGVRLALATKSSTAPTTLRHQQALEEALCHGWIDSTAGRGPDGTFVVRFTPRRPRSIWSRRNTELCLRLIAEGRMRRAGLAQVEAAQADGRWAAAYAYTDTDLPDDLAARLEETPGAKANFERLSAQNRFAILFRLRDAKRAETRARRLQSFVEMLARGEAIHPQGSSR
jgi:uncharacterized protein YdeI (YjbR/CyaY-like superfamily)